MTDSLSQTNRAVVEVETDDADSQHTQTQRQGCKCPHCGRIFGGLAGLRIHCGRIHGGTLTNTRVIVQPETNQIGQENLQITLQKKSKTVDSYALYHEVSESRSRLSMPTSLQRLQQMATRAAGTEYYFFHLLSSSCREKKQKMSL